MGMRHEFQCCSNYRHFRLGSFHRVSAGTLTCFTCVHGAGSKSGSIAASDTAKDKKLGEWKVDFEETGSQASAAMSSASRPGKAQKQSRAGTAATSDTEVSYDVNLQHG